MTEHMDYNQLLEKETDFHLRHAVERLREGLFDPVAVRLLTAHEDRLNRFIDNGFKSAESGKSAHLCVCGSYGQGKSHSLTYIHDKALKKGFVSSMINLDLREIPFHNIKLVYRELIANIKFPDSDNSLSTQWKDWIEKQKKVMEESWDLLNLIPEDAPHLFRSVLAGIAQKNMTIPKQKRQLRKHAQFRPREFPYVLANALNGDVVPISRLRQALKYRQVSFYRDASLVCKGIDPYIKMIESLTMIFKKMGYKGWTILFDEGESITQVRPLARSKSYQILHNMFAPEKAISGLYPVFAFTNDFFELVKGEDYERVRVRKEVEELYFKQNYAESWNDLTVYNLQDLSQKEWEGLSEKLMILYARAYNWQPPAEQTGQEMKKCLIESEGQETRFRLKSLVDQLDLLHQEEMLRSK